jgi:hypothetical protein
MAAFLRKLVQGGNKPWLQQQLQMIVKEHVDSKTEIATPTDFRLKLAEHDKLETAQMQYLLFLCLLTMQSLSQRLQITKEQLEYARTQIDLYCRGAPGQPCEYQGVLFKLRCHYLHL